ncbi:hypothetical protein [uncultured Roseobacter sp.]|uniref:hypothetical protein n=1 Tax=uncultured Roseobacter sp. TaxID=114847 RepID=UPI00260ED997|nr:hypothetical protein [uncultured Roseobacter sp.]
MSEIDEIPERIFRMASDALAQANTNAVICGRGVAYRTNMSILDAAHAGELFLKAVIATAHPLLIFRDLFSLDKSAEEPLNLRHIIEHGRTYNLEHLPKLLWVVHGERLPDMDSFDKVRKARNAIQHFCAPEIGRTGDLALTFLYRNIDPLIKRHFSVDAIEFIDPDDMAYLVENLIHLELPFSSSEVIEISEFNVSEALGHVSDAYRNSVEGRLCQYPHEEPSAR